MSNKFLQKLFFLLSFLLIFNTQTFAIQDNVYEGVDLSKYVNTIKNDEEKKSIKSSIKEEKKQIKLLFEKYDKYQKEKNIEKLSTLISDTYFDNDGFNKKQYLEIVEKNFELASEIETKTKIKKIDINGRYATIDYEETLTGVTSEYLTNIDKAGFIDASSEGTIYLQKFGSEWKFQSSYIAREILKITYAGARFFNIDLEAPQIIPENTNYTVRLKTNPIGYKIIFAAINNTDIIHPFELIENDNFMNVDQTGAIERILLSNHNSKNEYVIVNLGISEPYMISEDDVKLEMKGHAIIISRVNIIK